MSPIGWILRKNVSFVVGADEADKLTCMSRDIASSQMHMGSARRECQIDMNGACKLEKLPPCGEIPQLFPRRELKRIDGGGMAELGKHDGTCGMRSHKSLAYIAVGLFQWWFVDRIQGDWAETRKIWYLARRDQ